MLDRMSNFHCYNTYTLHISTQIIHTQVYVVVSLMPVRFAHLRNKTSVPVFYRGNKTWVRVRMHMN